MTLRMQGRTLGWMLLGGAALAAAPVLADGHEEAHERALGASLFGMNEVGHEGAGEDAGGDFSGIIDMEAGTLCYYLETYGLEDVAAAHVHKGAAGENGPPVVVLEANADDEVCAEVEADVLTDMAANEEGYYVNVHTAAIPAGAIRGQLGS